MYLDMLRCEEIYEPNHCYKFSGECVITKKEYSVVIPCHQLFEIRQGKHIQDACPQMSPDDREFLISGTSPEGWQQLFGDI